MAEIEFVKNPTSTLGWWTIYLDGRKAGWIISDPSAGGYEVCVHESKGGDALRETYRTLDRAQQEARVACERLAAEAQKPAPEGGEPCRTA